VTPVKPVNRHKKVIKKAIKSAKKVKASIKGIVKKLEAF